MQNCHGSIIFSTMCDVMLEFLYSYYHHRSNTHGIDRHYIYIHLCIPIGQTRHVPIMKYSDTTVDIGQQAHTISSISIAREPSYMAMLLSAADSFS